MAKRKLQRFNELLELERVFQFPYPLLESASSLRGNWRRDVFRNENRIVLELGCGRGEYTVELSRKYSGVNFIGMDIKGARLWRGAKTINEENILNAAFLRAHIEWLQQFFEPGEVSEIWITFPDPQPQDSRKNRRLTNPRFISLYRSILGNGGVLHLKTDNRPLFDYTVEVLGSEVGTFDVKTTDLYAEPPEGFDLSIQTTYEKRFLKEGLKINYLKFLLK